MGPPRYRRRFPANRKQKPDHSSYVQSLFQEFLRRNQQQQQHRLAPIPEEPQQPSSSSSAAAAEVNPRPNLYRESIDRILQQNQTKRLDSSGSISVTDQQSIVKRFFQTNKSNAVPEIECRRKGPVEPVYARFKRREGTDQFVKCDVSPGAAPAGGLIRWLEDRKRERLEREQRQRTKKVDEYLNLPGDFFSGRPALPFETGRNAPPPPPSLLADKTLASITSAFVPPVASTPLDRPFPAAICSPIISDPDEIHAKKVTVPKPKIVVKSKDLEFIKKFKFALDSFSEILMTADGMVSSLDRNYAELQRRRARERTFRANETSMAVNVQFGCDRKQTQSSLASPAMDGTGVSSFAREVLQLVTPEVKKTQRIELDPLLTYSPPCPKPDPDLELPPITTEANTTQKSLSISCLDSTFMTEFLQLPTPEDLDERKLDALLYYSPPFPKPPEPKKKVPIRLPEPDFSFLDNNLKLADRTQQQQQSEFSFEYSQEDFKGPIFPSQDGGGGPRNTVYHKATTLDFDESSHLLGGDSSLEFSFSQGSDWA